MKKLSFKTMQTFLLCATLSLICEGCSAMGKREVSTWAYSPVDSVLRAELKDSISSVVLNPKTVLVQRLKVDKGEITVKESRKLSKSEIGVICFQMATFEESDTAAIVFGRFVPNVRYVFKAGKTQVVADVDFGLKKIYFKTAKGDVIKRFDISDKNLLKFSNILFKEDEFLIHILKTK